MSSSSFDSVGGIVAPLHVRLDKERSVGKSYTQSVPLHICTVVSYARSGTSYWYASALRDSPSLRMQKQSIRDLVVSTIEA